MKNGTIPFFTVFWETENGTIPGKTGQLASMPMTWNGFSLIIILWDLITQINAHTWFRWMFLVVKDKHVTWGRFCSNDGWVLWHVASSVNFTFVVDFDFYFDFTTHRSKSSKFWNSVIITNAKFVLWIIERFTIVPNSHMHSRLLQGSLCWWKDCHHQQDFRPTCY